MNLTTAIFCAAGVLSGVYALKRARFRDFLLSSCLGLGALFAADLLLGFAGRNMPVDVFTVTTATVGGMPGVILITVLQAMLPVQ